MNNRDADELGNVDRIAQSALLRRTSLNWEVHKTVYLLISLHREKSNVIVTHLNCRFLHVHTRLHIIIKIIMPKI